MKKIIKDVYFHKEKEDNEDLVEEAKKKGFKKYKELSYFGYELGLKVEITEDANGDVQTKVLEIEGQDISDKDIYI